MRNWTLNSWSASVQTFCTVKPAAFSHRRESVERVFVRVLGENRFAIGDVERAVADLERLVRLADELNDDSAPVWVVAGAVLELAEIEVGADSSG